jgi:Domain of unknown function (DUF4183)
MALIFPAPAQIKNLLAPTANTDAATKLYVDTQIGSVSANAAGSNTQVQFNSSSSFGASSNFTFDTASNVLTVTGNIISSNASLGNLVTSNYFAGTLTTNAQPNITSVGTLTSLSVTGDVSGNNFTVNGNLTVLGSTLTVNNEVVNQTETITGNLVAGNVSFTGSNVSLGNISNLHISGGTSGYFLKTDGSGNLSWAAQSSLTSNVDNFTGDGSNTAFTLSSTPAGANYTMVAVQGVLQPKSTYTVSGSTLTFSSAPPSTAIIEVTTFGGAVVSGSGSGSAFTWNIASSNSTMTANNGYFVDTSAGPKTMTLPASPSLGDTIRINDLAGSFSTNNLTVARNGNKIQGAANDLLVDVDQSSFGLVFSNSTYGWKVLEL